MNDFSLLKVANEDISVLEMSGKDQAMAMDQELAVDDP